MSAIDLEAVRALAETMADRDAGWATWPVMRHPQCGEAGRQMLAVVNELETARQRIDVLEWELAVCRSAGMPQRRNQA